MVVQEKGFSLLELLVSIGLFSIVMLASVSVFTRGSEAYYDISIREGTNDAAKAVMNIVGADFRTIGNGIPFDQGLLYPK